MTCLGPLIGVLALQGDVHEHRRLVESLGARTVAVRRPTELDDLDGIVIPGGESTTIHKLLSAFELLGPLRAAIRGGLPAYGSCAGMILLADRIADPASGQESLGGLDITVRRNAFGRQVDSFETDLVVAGIAGGPLRAIFIRAPVVESVGPGVHVLATVESGLAAGRIVAVRQDAVLATSFHPEVTGDVRVHAEFLRIVRDRS